MDKKSLAILFVASSFVSSSFATGILNKLIPKTKPMQAITSTHTTIKHDRPYTDFTGTWTGDCGEDTLTLAIKNDEYSINVDGTQYTIGGLQGSSNSDDKLTSNNHVSFEWNADGSELIVHDAYVVKDFVGDAPFVTMGLAKTSISQKKGQLNIDGSFVNTDDLTENQQPRKMHCVLNKKK